MKKILFFLSIGLILYFFFREEKRNQIAILTPATHPSLEEIERAFKEKIEVESKGKYKIVTYNAQGNKTLMQSEAEEILRRNFDLVFTIGTNASYMVKELFSKKGVSTPIVFTCVNDPIGFEIVSSEERPLGHITGVKEIVDYEKEIELVIKKRPELKKILLVYNPMEPGLIKDKKRVEEIFFAKNLTLLAVEVFQTNEVMSKAEQLLKGVDAILILKDNTVVRAVEALIKLSKRYQIPLIASDLDSYKLGASLAFGVEEKEFGLEGAEIALDILENGKHPGSIAVKSVDKFLFLEGK
ncbi:MAG: hypothetical protein FJZ59_00680 [Chlamydiae bacterium]|nr:hypothetical protein [Chlamydiota bacterium]